MGYIVGRAPIFCVEFKKWPRHLSCGPLVPKFIINIVYLTQRDIYCTYTYVFLEVIAGLGFILGTALLRSITMLMSNLRNCRVALCVLEV